MQIRTKPVDFTKTIIVLLLGYPGVGKRTVGTALVERLNGVLVDNQLINIPILTLFKWDGKFQLPSDVFEYTAPIRQAILDTIEKLAPSTNSYVFTNVLEAADAVASRSEYDKLRALAERRGSVFQAVRVTCDPQVQVTRIDTPDRRARLKGSDPEGYRRYTQNVPLWWPPEDELLTIDTTTATPEQSAELIYNHLSN